MGGGGGRLGLRGAAAPRLRAAVAQGRAATRVRLDASSSPSPLWFW